MPIKTYRGLLPSGAQERINLKTNNGKIGYRILKFEGIGVEPGTTVMEHTLKVYKIKQTAINNAVNFEDDELIAVCYISDNAGRQLDIKNAVMFDRVIFNQDIFITCEDTAGDPVTGMNYYLELEQIKLSDNETTMATLQSIRSSYESYTPAGPS